MADSQSREVFFLKQISNQDYSEDFAQNMVQVNTTIKALSKYLISMQKGIDDLNRDIIEVIQDFIDEVIIFFGGGAGGDSGFEFGDLKYIFQAIGGLFGFENLSGNNKPGAANNFFTNFLKPLEGFNNAIRGFFDILFGFLEDVPIIGDVIESIANAMNVNKATAEQAVADVVDVETRIVKVQEIFSVISSRSMADGPDPTGESTFRYEKLELRSLTGTSGGQGVPSHDHNAGTYELEYPFVPLTQNMTMFGWVRQGLLEPKAQASWIAYKEGTVTDFRISIKRMAKDGSVTEHFYSTSQHNGLVVSNKGAWMQVAFPPLTPEYMGDIIGAEFNMMGSGKVWIAGIYLLAPLALPGFRPAQIGAIKPLSGVNQTSYSDADMLSYASGTTPYVQFGSDVGQIGARRTFVDTFDGRGANMGPNWILRALADATDNLEIASNNYVINPSNQLIETWSDGQWIQPLSTDQQMVEMNFTNLNTNTPVALYICGNGGFTEWIMLRIRSDEAVVYTCPSRDYTKWVVRATWNISALTSCKWSFRYDPATKAFIARRNDILIGSWIDSGNVVKHGEGYRYPGFAIDHFNFTSGGRALDFRAEDWIAA